MTTHTNNAPSAATERTTREQKLDAARAVLNAGFDSVAGDPEALARFLAFRSRFHDYSLNNAVLIWCQRPTARHCMGYRAWQGHGRQVRKGERGLTILAPVTRKREETADDRAVVGYRTATVFDYEQTDAVEDSALVYVPPAPRLNADDPTGLTEALVAAAESLEYAVRHAETGYADGRCSFAARMITLQASLSPADRAAVLCHELAHALAHDPSAPAQNGDAQSPEKTTTAQRELQAEGAAFIALSALGLDSSRASLPYLQGWSGGDAEALRREMTAIDRISRDLLARLDALAHEGETE